MTAVNPIGEYVIFLDGEEVHRQKNAMSIAGKNAAMRTLIGYQSRFANQMAIGIGSGQNIFDTNSKFITNQRLDGEIDRIPISSAFVDTSEQYSKLIFKASVSKDERYSISELGLYSPALTSTNNNQIILSFEESENISGGTLITETSSFSYKDSATQIGTSSTITSNNVKRIGYLSDDDEISFTYRKNSTFNSSVTVTFWSGDSASISFLFTNSASGIISQSQKISQKSAGTLIESQWNNISKITIANGTGGSIVADLLRFNQSIETNNVDAALLSRVLLSSPIEKAKNQQLDIEYYLSLGFNEAI